MDWLIYDWNFRHERVKEILNPFMANAPHHIEANQLICNTNQLVGFYVMVNIGCECVNGKLLCSENLFKVNANFPERDPRTLFDQVDTRPKLNIFKTSMASFYLGLMFVQFMSHVQRKGFFC